MGRDKRKKKGHLCACVWRAEKVIKVRAHMYTHPEHIHSNRAKPQKMMRTALMTLFQAALPGSLCPLHTFIIVQCKDMCTETHVASSHTHNPKLWFQSYFSVALTQMLRHTSGVWHGVTWKHNTPNTHRSFSSLIPVSHKSTPRMESRELWCTSK